MSYPKMPPSKEQIADLELFAGLEMEQITVVRTACVAEQAFEELKRSGQVGFDTESKPTFYKGEKSEGPHVLQFSTLERAFVFQSHVAETMPVVMALLESEKIHKIGFGLRGDLSHISMRFGIRASAIVDLDMSFKKLGYRNAVGAKSAIAIFFQQRMVKSKSITTSNWSNPVLTERQLVYAANDAYAAIQVHHALKKSGVSEV